MRKSVLSIIMAMVAVLLLCFPSHAWVAGGPSGTTTYYALASVADQGGTTGRSVKKIIDGIGSTKKATLVFAHSSNATNTTYTFTTSETITSNIFVEVEPGALLDGAGTLTIDGPFKATTKCIGSSITIGWGNGIDGIYLDWYASDNSGITDISTEMHRAVAHADGKPIYVTGIYNAETSNNTDIVNDLILIGLSENAELDGADNNNSGFRIDANISKLFIDNIKFDNFRYVFYVADPNYYINEFTFTNSSITDSITGIWLRCKTRNAIFTNNRINGLSSAGAAVGIQLGDTSLAPIYEEQKKFIISNNEFYNIVTSTNDEEAHAILLYGRECDVCNNIIENVQNTGNGLSAEGIYYKCKYGNISNNILTNAGTGDASITVKGSDEKSKIIINGNNLNSTDGAYSGIYTEISNVIVSNNFLTGFGLYAIRTHFNININNLQIIGNQIKNHRGLYAIFINSYGKNIMVSNNLIENLIASQGSISSTSAIYIYPLYYDSSNYIISGNIMYDANTNATSSIRMVQILSDTNNNISNLSIYNNKIYANNDSVDEYGIRINVSSGSIYDNLMIYDNDLVGVPNNKYPLSIFKTGTLLNAIIKDNIGDEEIVTTASPTLQWWGISYIDSNSNAVNATLPDAYGIGQEKIIIMIDETNSSTVSISHHETSDPEIATFDAIDESLYLKWTGNQWVTLQSSCTFL